MALIDAELQQMLRDRALCFISTLMPDGSPQVTLTWVDTDGERILINSVQTHQKVRNVARDPRVALAIAPPDRPGYFVQLRGQVTGVTTDGAAEHIDLLSQRYTGGPYAWYGGRDQVRVLMTIEIAKISKLF